MDKRPFEESYHNGTTDGNTPGSLSYTTSSINNKVPQFSIDDANSPRDTHERGNQHSTKDSGKEVDSFLSIPQLMIDGESDDADETPEQVPSPTEKSAPSKTFGWKSFLPPCFLWIGKYDWRSHFMNDCLAGVTICVLLVPQGMAYAQLAGVPPVYGLYTAFLAPIFYLLLGTSRQISFGATAVTTVMTKAIIDKSYATSYGKPVSSVTLDHHNQNNEIDESVALEESVAVLASTTLLVGVIQLAFGVLRFGKVASLMTATVTRSFTTACAFHVVASQLKFLIGLKQRNIESSNLTDPAAAYFQSSESPSQNDSEPISPIFTSRIIGGIIFPIADIITKRAFISWPCLIIGICCIFVLLLFKCLISPQVKKHFWPSMPMEIPVDVLVVIVGTVISWGFDLSNHDGLDVPVVGSIPSGFPSVFIPDPTRWLHIGLDALPLAVVAFALSISLAKIMAKKHEYGIDANRDLFAYAISNIGLSFFAGMPSSACMSRTMLLDSLGTKSQIQGFVSSLVIVLILFFIGPLFKWLPNSILAAIVITAIRNMFLQVQDIVGFWKASSWWNLFLWILTFLCTLFLSVPLGLSVGIGFSLLRKIWEMIYSWMSNRC